MGGDDDIEIDLTAADRADGLVPIRWNGPRGDPNGNGDRHGHGPRGLAEPVTAVVPRIVSLASFIPPASPTPPEPASAPVITLLEPDAWSDVPESVTLRRIMASRGARALTVLVVTVFTALLAATVLLWQRVEATQRPTTPPAPVVDAAMNDQLRAVNNRLNSLETKLASMLDASGTAVTRPAPTVLQYELAVLRGCVAEFQRAIDNGSIRGGRFVYCG